MRRFKLIALVGIVVFSGAYSQAQENEFEESGFREEAATTESEPHETAVRGGSYRLAIPGIPGGGSFGTKFVCCKTESVSSATGGGTIYTPMLRDRALTQVDARARCGIYRMYWATHSCPSDSVADGGSGQPAPRTTRVEFCNHSPHKIYAAYAYYYAPNGTWSSRGWRKLAPHSCKTVDLGNYRIQRLFVFGESADRRYRWPTEGRFSFCMHRKDKFHYRKADQANCSHPDLVKYPFYDWKEIRPGQIKRFNFLWN